jgi:hypothetical protein
MSGEPRCMRRWITAVITALSAAVLLESGVSASAAPSAPAPTLHISTSVSDRTLPTSPMRGAWSVERRSAVLQLRGYTLTGSTTSVRAVWTSRWEWARAHRPALEVQVDDGGWMLAPGLDESAWQYELEARTVGSNWKRVPGGAGVTHTDGLLTRVGTGASTTVITLHRVHVQWRLVFSAQTRSTTQVGLSLSARIP